MKKIGVLLVIVLFVLTGCQSLVNKTPSVSVRGSGSVEATPDMASFRVSVSKLAPTTSEAQSLLNQELASVIDILEDDQNVPKKDITTAYVSVGPKYSWIDGKQTLDGQQAQSSLDVKIRDLEKIGPVFDALSVVSGVSISSVSLTVSDESGYIAAAQKKAMENAHSAAQNYADGAGMSLGSVRSIQEEGAGNGDIILPLAYNEAMAKSSMRDSLEYRPDTVSVSTSVVVVYNLK